MKTRDTSFVGNLRANLEADPTLTRRGKRILAILNAHPSRRRTRRIEAMERHTEAQLVVMKINLDESSPDMTLDWSSIDWAALIETILKLLLALLPFILML